MALSIKTDEADRLARELAQLRGISITEAVTVALREQCVRERRRPKTPEEKLRALNAMLDRLGPPMDSRSPTKAEWDEASGDTD